MRQIKSISDYTKGERELIKILAEMTRNFDCNNMTATAHVSKYLPKLKRAFGAIVREASK